MKSSNLLSTPVNLPGIGPGYSNTRYQQWPEVKLTVTTAVAAKMLNRSPQTLRKWACYENGPLRPLRINGRLAWPVDAIAALVSGNPLRLPHEKADQEVG